MEQSLLDRTDMFIAAKKGEWMSGQSVFITCINDKKL